MQPQIETDRVVLKLTAEAALGATELPEIGLPRGLDAFDTLISGHRITEGNRLVREHGTPIADPELFSHIGLDRIYVLRLPDPDGEAKVMSLVEELRGQPWVEYAEPVYLLWPTAIPNDSSFPLQWAHRNTGQTVNGFPGTSDADADSDLAWNTNTGSPTAIVAVLDGGMDLGHPDLVDNLIAGYDFINDDPTVPLSSHGTGVAGIAAARGNNGIGVAGICWSCSIMPLAIANSQHETDAIRFAADNGADVINMSHTFGALWLQSVIDATEYAVGLGALPFASATNFNGYNIGTPAVYPEVVSVGGSDQNDRRVYAFNDLTELTAPGPNTRTTWTTPEYVYFGGTSSSCPFAAGLGALLRSERPNLHVRELRHLLRLSADDQVGIPSEDTAGWDQFMGYGRVNAFNAMQQIDGPWLALDRPHYVCAGDLTVALKDPGAGASVEVTLTGSVGADVETMMVTPVSGATGYYEGTLPLSWAGVDGPVTIQDGKLDVVHAENFTASAGALSADAFLDCMKKVCLWGNIGVVSSGDCDQDAAMDPGELWLLTPALVNLQTEQMFGVEATLVTTNPDVTVLKGDLTSGTINPFSILLPGPEESFRVQVAPGAAVNGIADFDITISGTGWESDQTACVNEEGFGSSFSFPINRDLGAQVVSWDFDDGTAMGFEVEASHGTTQDPSGDLSECDGLWGPGWNVAPVTDRAHSGTHSMRLGSGSVYAGSTDAGLVSPVFTAPTGSAAVSFFTWMDSFLFDAFRAWDGMIVEAKQPIRPDWTFLSDGTYGRKQVQTECTGVPTRVPFGAFEHVDMLAGDGSGTDAAGDTFDVAHTVNLSQFAGLDVQLRFRFGSNDSSDPADHGTGAWLDTIAIHGPYVTDIWPGAAPQNLQGSQANCSTSFDLSWTELSGSGDYEIFRSEVSCADAMASLDLYDTAAGTTYSDTGVVEETQYNYAVGGTEATTGCPTVRACIAGSCPPCVAPPDPEGLVLDKSGNDVHLAWFGSAPSGPTWNVYRNPDSNPALWGAALATGVTDEDAATPGIQFTDVGGLGAGSVQHYLVTETTCAESPLR